MCSAAEFLRQKVNLFCSAWAAKHTCESQLWAFILPFDFALYIVHYLLYIICSFVSAIISIFCTFHLWSYTPHVLISVLCLCLSLILYILHFVISWYIMHYTLYSMCYAIYLIYNTLYFNPYSVMCILHCISYFVTYILYFVFLSRMIYVILEYHIWYLIFINIKLKVEDMEKRGGGSASYLVPPYLASYSIIWFHYPNLNPLLQLNLCDESALRRFLITNFRSPWKPSLFRHFVFCTKFENRNFFD